MALVEAATIGPDFPTIVAFLLPKALILIRGGAQKRNERKRLAVVVVVVVE